ncbi:hypothetical protein OAI49_00665 [Synechococcus sp. AH-558-M21]|nr:hypothetical protein [Synechococcus sp. AH-558-M21]
MYVATGERCCLEAIENAKRSHYFNKNLAISIKTDLTELACRSNVFQTVIKFDRPSFSYRDKIVGLMNLPFRYTLFLDSDAALVYSCEDLFSSLTSVDLAAALAPVRHPPGWSDSAVPLIFPELNTGVLLLRRHDKNNNLLVNWLSLYDQLVESHSQFWDQASFRSVLWRSINNNDLQFMHLPSEVNLRTTKPWIVGRGMPALVVHGRFPDKEFLPFVNYLNHDIDRFRTFSEWLYLNPETEIRPRFDRTFD